MHTCISLYISHMHTYTQHTHTHTHTHTQDVCYDQTQSLPFNTMECMLVGSIHTTHQLLHVLDLYILDCLLKVALRRPLRSRNLLQMTPSAQILGGCAVADPAYFRFIKTGQLWARAHNCPVLMSLKYAWIHHWVCLTSSRVLYTVQRHYVFATSTTCCMNRTGVLDCCDVHVCSGLVCCMMEEGRGCGIAPAHLLKREGVGGKYYTSVHHPQIFTIEVLKPWANMKSCV